MFVIKRGLNKAEFRFLGGGLAAENDVPSEVVDMFSQEAEGVERSAAQSRGHILYSAEETRLFLKPMKVSW